MTSEFIKTSQRLLTVICAVLLLLFAYPLTIHAITNIRVSDTATTIKYSFDYVNSKSWANFRVYIDTDRNVGSGIAVNGIGANYKIDNYNLYVASGGVWQTVKQVGMVNNGLTASWTINRVDIGETKPCGEDQNLVFQTQNAATSETTAPMTYTFTTNANPCPTITPTSNVPTNTPTRVVTRTPTRTATRTPTRTNTPGGPTLTPTRTRTPGPSPTTGPVPAQRIVVPSYFYPDATTCTANCYWTQLGNAYPTVGIAIINPGSGPGANVDPNYLRVTQNSQAKGVSVLGYVHTSYGNRALATVQAEIDKYYTWYNVNGIFIDEMMNMCTSLNYYQSLYNYIKTKGDRAIVIQNPGAWIPECLVNTGDIIAIFENSYANYVNWQLQGWEVNYPASKFWHLVYNTTEAQMPNAIALTKQRNAGWIYVTADNLPNPWDTLPQGSYWSTELSLVGN